MRQEGYHPLLQSRLQSLLYLHLTEVGRADIGSVTVYTESYAVIMPIHTYTYEVHHVYGGINAWLEAVDGQSSTERHRVNIE